MTGVLTVIWAIIAIGVGQELIERVGLLALWGMAIAIMVIILGIAGHEINGRWLGILIDTRNKISLSHV